MKSVSSRLFFLHFLTKNIVKKITAATPTRPPAIPPTMAEVEVPAPVVALVLGAELEVEEAGGMVVKRVAAATEVDGKVSVTRGYRYHMNFKK